MRWELYPTGTRSASKNMSLDASLLEQLPQRAGPLLHTYGWSRPSITYGYFIRPEEWIDMDAAHELGVDLARRPTGGGITFHFGDLAFSALVPAAYPCFSSCTLENYAWINSAVANAVSRCFNLDGVCHLFPPSEESAPFAEFCMAHPTKYDVVLQGRKIGGAAQRRTKHGFLHQGTICLRKPPEAMLKRLLRHYDRVAPLMDAFSYPLGDRTAIPFTEESLIAALYENLLNCSKTTVCALGRAVVI